MVNQKKIEEAVRLFLEGIGEDTDREGLMETPDRIARMCTELFAGMDDTAAVHLSKTFSVTNNDIVVEKDILFYSICEHHFLPFYGRAHIAYVPDGKVVGLSKLARTVEVFARRPQIQEQMTAQIADAVMEYLEPGGVMVMVEAEHMCMTMRGIKKPGSQTVTIARRGCFEDNLQLQNDFFYIIGKDTGKKYNEMEDSYENRNKGI
ncbi:MAG: GTP cyclohydrolase I FolE [Blautia sp.]|nr:GTP cyclohydrolase I FolE [Muribaculaceae bacterium]MCM1144386.1 GTP cyclohydrolase I FolE [Lachnoclostridium sp.]MCM1210268.1 GTP cyclohydrolase I FolE [Blautia sp.]